MKNKAIVGIFGRFDKEIDRAGVGKEIDLPAAANRFSPLTQSIWRLDHSAESFGHHPGAKLGICGFDFPFGAVRRHRIGLAGLLVVVLDVRAPRDDLAPHRRLSRVCWPPPWGLRGNIDFCF